MREKYETLSLTSLRDIAKARGIKRVTGVKKAELIDSLCALDDQEKASAASNEDAKAKKAA
ncbi:MAG: Rho termination factor N-terminal domain-containing protein, partial [Butyrivibrio sp.]|uniref:Rho termination factor N-terminal domain-containing protein n=1 Tax=Butyrivibrio sp. TaxID=28121 RepID=UPI0025F91C47